MSNMLILCAPGNNLLGGQDFNLRLFKYLTSEIEQHYNTKLTDKEDLQTLRTAVENTKIKLTDKTSADVIINLQSLGKHVTFKTTVTRTTFEHINKDLFDKVLVPIITVLKAIDMPKEEVDEVVLVGGSTRIPRVRQLIKEFFNKDPNTSIDPELAVAMGVSVQAGIIGGMWPLTVSAVELPTYVKKINL